MRKFLIVGIATCLAVVFLPLLLAAALDWGPDLSLLPKRQRTVSLSDGRGIHVVEVGEGSPVVLVHGLPGNAADWADLPKQLAAQGNYRVIAYDRVGYGFSTRKASEETGYRYDSNASELGELLDALGLQQVTLVGWSYGGAVAQSFAATSPERVSHLVLVGSAGPTRVEGDRNLLDRILASSFGEWILLWVSSVPPLGEALTRSSLAQAFAREAAIPDGWVEYTQAELSLPGTVHAFLMEANLDEPEILVPERLTMPSLVIHGADDYLVPFAVGEDLHARLPHSQFVPVLSGSHMLPVTHPEVIAEKIHELVRSY